MRAHTYMVHGGGPPAPHMPFRPLLVAKVAERMTHEAFYVQMNGPHGTDFKVPDSWSSLAPERLDAKVVAHNVKEALERDNLMIWNTALPASDVARNEERLEALCIAIDRITKQAEELHRFWEDQRDAAPSWQCGKEDEPPFCFPPLLPMARGGFAQEKVKEALKRALTSAEEPLNQHRAFTICEGAGVVDCESGSASESVDEGSSIGDRSGSEDEEEDDEDDSNDSVASLDEEEEEQEDEEEGEEGEEPVPPQKKQK